ncbi:MAG: hypothetical protein IE926_01830 [Micrococcales bacterium]|nr:hypothetical protein [Micrococcales bacterium]
MTKSKTAASKETQRKAKQARQSSGPMTLKQVVGELVDAYGNHDDVPLEHVCTTEGPSACTHGEHWHEPLLQRLAGLAQPGTGAPRDPDSKPPKGQRGSPAPWAAGPVHLVDEAYRGAVRFDADLRRRLELGPLHVHRGIGERARIGALCAGGRPPFAPCTHPTCQPIRKAITTEAAETPIEIAGPAALRGLPLLVDLLLERDPTHWLVAGPLVDPEHPDRGRAWGEVERSVRRWHKDAKELTGHVDRPVILRQRFNPFAGQKWLGPTCAGPWTCGHLSCRLIYLAPRPRWENAYCPHCGSAGFPWDATWGVLTCDHPRCRDENGRRPAWSMEAFMRPITEIAEAFEEQQ